MAKNNKHNNGKGNGSKRERKVTLSDKRRNAEKKAAMIERTLEFESLRWNEIA
jgi:hypothetical protein